MTRGQAYAIILVIILVIFLILFAINAWYWSQIHFNTTETSPVTKSTAGWLFWSNLIFAVIDLIALIVFAVLAYRYYRKAPAIITAQELQTMTSTGPTTTIPLTSGPLPAMGANCPPVLPGTPAYRL